MGAASECRDAPSRRFYTHRRGPVAQSVEQGTFNPKVAGSIPARPIREAPAKTIVLPPLPSVTRRLSVRVQYGHSIRPEKRPPSSRLGCSRCFVCSLSAERSIVPPGGAHEKLECVQRVGEPPIHSCSRGAADRDATGCADFTALAPSRASDWISAAVPCRRSSHVLPVLTHMNWDAVTPSAGSVIQDIEATRADRSESTRRMSGHPAQDVSRSCFVSVRVASAAAAPSRAESRWAGGALNGSFELPVGRRCHLHA